MNIKQSLIQDPSYLLKEYTLFLIFLIRYVFFIFKFQLNSFILFTLNFNKEKKGCLFSLIFYIILNFFVQFRCNFFFSFFFLRMNI